MFKKLLALVLGVALMGAAVGAQAADKVVYHVSDSASQALSALRNMRNQLDTAPDTSIKLVAHADGVDFLMTDYKDAVQVGPLISALAARGVAFEVCEITLKNRNLPKDAFVMEADFTPSGVVRITRLQQEGYSYIKP
ncbi:DsrE family protein [Achromobacter deleyi]|uniref:DsrE family protein n=1 Tax=Achromobacter deleyi TaxID=1353891 RepID=UPI001492CF4D|nr:DsrE family protein [Achromobacter deleyi]QVQ28491.1 DsrE family protein [Achromobacter deleyi]UIP18599.1 DsrE family protein [Achromobacter deleyi]